MRIIVLDFRECLSSLLLNIFSFYRFCIISLKTKKNGDGFLFLLMVSPLSASLSWSKESLTRSLFLLIPIIISASYGISATLYQIKKNNRLLFIFVLMIIGGFFSHNFMGLLSISLSETKTTIHSWQCGYSEVGAYIQENYQKYSHFYISKDVGMPYIFTFLPEV